MLEKTALDLLFNDARTHYYWQDKPVDDSKLVQIFDLMKMAPTSANCFPLRIVFVKSDSAKNRLKPLLDAGNVDKTMSAPATAILAMDMEFYEKLPQLFPHADARAWFAGNDAKIYDTAFRNSSLQAAYFIIAARAVGLDTGPMSGFDADGINSEFFAGTTFKVNMLCNLGYGDGSKLHPRLPRPDFKEFCNIL